MRMHRPTYRYLINNANFESYIKIVKKDAETGNTIPYAGAGFQIYDPNGELVTMTFTYPEVTTIDTFYTTEYGHIIISGVGDFAGASGCGRSGDCRRL